MPRLRPRLPPSSAGRRSAGGHLLDSADLAPSRSTPAGDRPIDLNSLVSPSIGSIVVGLALVALVLTVVGLVQARRIRRLARRLDRLTRDAQGRSLEAILDAHLDKVYAVAAELDELSARSAIVESNGRRAIQRVGLVRYNPFEETGGNQSFALALLDADDHGFIITSLHARSGTRIYARALTAGRADSQLSGEEEEALRLARSATGGRPVISDRTSVRSARGA